MSIINCQLYIEFWISFKGVPYDCNVCSGGGD